MYFDRSDSAGGANFGVGLASCKVVCVGLTGSGRDISGDGAAGLGLICAGGGGGVVTTDLICIGVVGACLGGSAGAAAANGASTCFHGIGDGVLPGVGDSVMSA